MAFLFYDILFCIVFFIIVGIFLYRNKKNVRREGIFYLYRTKFGLKFIEKLVKKHRKFFNFIAKINIVIGFIGMAAVFTLLILSCYKIAIMAEVIKTPPIVPLLPWINFPGMPTLYFTIWVIAIALLAIVHEGSHGIFSRLNRVRLKSTGFGVLGPIVTAFVEPDEKQLIKKSPQAQLSVFSAGPVANFIAAGIFFIIISALINPIYASSISDVKIKVIDVKNNSPAYVAGIEKNDIIFIENVNKTGDAKQYIGNLTKFLLELKPNQTVSMAIENKNKSVAFLALPSEKNISRGYTGIKEIEIVPKFEGMGRIVPFISDLFFWIFITNIFVGLFNLMPFWIVDGGRMFYAAAFAITKSKKKALGAMKKATAASLFLILMIFFIWMIRMIFG